MPDKDLIANLVRAAGLDRAWAEFPDDVVDAYKQARSFEAGLVRPEDPAAEPWPPMRAAGTP